MVTRPASPIVALTDGTAEDLDDIMRIMTSAFDPCFGEGWSKSQCLGILPLAGVSLVVARDRSGEAIGFSLARAIADEAELLLLAVETGHQGEGIGGMLLEHFLSESRHRGQSRLHLEVRDGNPAVSLYRRYGFTPVGRRRSYYRGRDGERRDALTLAVELA